jgi:hypothetical protein
VTFVPRMWLPSWWASGRPVTTSTPFVTS